MAEMQIGRSWIKPGLDAQRPAGLLGLNQPLAQFVLSDELRQALLQIVELFVDRHYIHGKAAPRVSKGTCQRGDSAINFAVNAGASMGIKCEYSVTERSAPWAKLEASSGAVGDLLMTSAGSAAFADRTTRTGIRIVSISWYMSEAGAGL